MAISLAKYEIQYSFTLKSVCDIMYYYNSVRNFNSFSRETINTAIEKTIAVILSKSIFLTKRAQIIKVYTL